MVIQSDVRSVKIDYRKEQPRKKAYAGIDEKNHEGNAFRI